MVTPLAHGALEVVPARAQMGSSLGFHIILACMGIAFPAVVMTAHYLGPRRNDEAALLLARRWSKVMAVLVAVGAVSGTVLSFDMGLLWPGLMGRYGSVIGIPFAVEGIAFLLEAVFTAIYLYGWDRLPRWAHFWCLAPVVITGILGAVSVVAANSWMNAPAGYALANGQITRVDPVAVFFNNAAWYEAPHMVLAAYMVAGGLAATPDAIGLLRGRRDRYSRIGFLSPFTIAAVAAPIQIAVGDTAARAIASQHRPRLAADALLHGHRHRLRGHRPGPRHLGEPGKLLGERDVAADRGLVRGRWQLSGGRVPDRGLRPGRPARAAQLFHPPGAGGGAGLRGTGLCVGVIIGPNRPTAGGSNNPGPAS
jgi:cytochrome bd-type quinol oxidase subunit 1